jgi:hypothetical protein
MVLSGVIPLAIIIHPALPQNNNWHGSTQQGYPNIELTARGRE